MPVLKRQFITDAAGTPIGVILPLDEYTLVADTLEQRLAAELDGKLHLMEQAQPAPFRSLYGALADLGPAPSAEDIDEARREAWGNFPRDDI